MKSDEMNNLLKQLTGIDTNKSIEERICPFCQKSVGEFKDKLSEKEFEISGLCQNCQDGVFSNQ